MEGLKKYTHWIFSVLTLQIFGLLGIFFVILESQASIGESSSNFSVQSEMNHIYFLLPNDQYRHCCCCLIAKLCTTLCDPMDWGRWEFPALHYLPEFAQTHVHWVGDAIQPSHPLSPSSFPCSLSFPASGSFPMVSFHSNHKEGQCQRTLKLPHNCAHFTC